MGIRRCISWSLLFVLSLGWPAKAWAMPASTPPEPASRVLCESIAERWNHCPLPFKGEVVMLRQLSRNACVLNHSWGRDGRGVWVSRGCRAEFGPLPRLPATSSTQTNATDDGWVARRVRCESRRGAYTHCPVAVANGVRFVKQLSKVDCELGRSWGMDEAGVWVSRGCRAEFEVRVEPGVSAGLWRRLFHRSAADEGSGQVAGQPLKCESQAGVRHECVLSLPARRVELVRQLSNAVCTLDVSWGWQGDRVWVDKGCRAEFLHW